MNWFKKKKEEIKKVLPKTLKTPSDFRIGEVYRMAVAERSHETQPYYIEIKDVEIDFIETNIPERHSLKIYYGSPEWDYRVSRMTYVGNDKKSRIFLYGQKLRFSPR